MEEIMAFRYALTASLTAVLMASTVAAQSVDLSKWSREYVRSIAGTEEFRAKGKGSYGGQPLGAADLAAETGGHRVAGFTILRTAGTRKHRFRAVHL
jgi:hypothetical protein